MKQFITTGQSETVYFIDIAIPNNHNLHEKYAEKLAKYSELSLEIKDQSMENGHSRRNSSCLISKWDRT
jgi:hypothetical protein